MDSKFSYELGLEATHMYAQCNCCFPVFVLYTEIDDDEEELPEGEAGAMENSNSP